MDKRRTSGIPTQSTFRAAVYEHPVILPPNRTSPVPRAVALANMMKNLVHYKLQAELAAKEGVDIIVFPEVGLYGWGFTRKAQTAYLEYIPNPEVETWNPCNEPERYLRTEVQQFLSCLAKNNTMYVVANVGDCQPCNITTDPSCPQDGHYQYNTNVVYDKAGILIARYHKENLFYEYQFDKPKFTEYVYFDTPFGRFGVFTCFDILFKEPAITLIKKYNVSNIVFPTAWMDAMPLLAAIQFHSAFAAGLGVNLFAANLHFPEMRVHGSGIYSPKGALSFYFNNRSNDGKLLVSNVNSISDMIGVGSEDENKYTFWNSSLKKLQLNGVNEDNQFSSDVFHDRFTFIPLDSTVQSTNLVVCQNALCCHLEYEFAGSIISDDFAFGVFDGLHTYEGQYYFQICALLKCGSERKLCGSPLTESSTKFKMINIRGTFQTDFVFPEILLIENETLALANIEHWKYQNRSLSFFSDEHPVLSAALFGRFYDRDMYTDLINRSTGSYINSDTILKPVILSSLALGVTVLIN